uniref:Uncharacterized protein n=1 Tax=Heliothis virescens TaxID=7102 RepID=A0A2A4JC72_HELVI
MNAKASEVPAFIDAVETYKECVLVDDANALRDVPRHGRRLKDAAAKCCRPAKKSSTTDTQKEARAAKDVGFTKKTAIQTYHYLREVCEVAEAHDKDMLGGSNDVVEIDETHLYTRKVMQEWFAAQPDFIRLPWPAKSSPTVRLHYPEGIIYLCQDNCRVHTCRVVQEWFVAQPDIIRLSWPAKSSPTVRLHYPEGIIYLCQDNCHLHTCRVMQKWFAAQPDIIRLPWPAKSSPTVRLNYPEGIIYLCQDNCRVHTCRVVQEWFAAQLDIILLP